MNSRKWTIGKSDEALCEKIRKETGFLPLTVKLLANRGLDTPEKIKAFLDKDNIPLYDPFLLKDMDAAVKRINEAIEKKQSVCIYGDYDVDGVTSTVMLYSYLRTRGLDCEYFIPERISEGYGLSLPVIEKMKDRIDLIITVDTGVTAVAEAEYAKEIGIDMVITDHHSCREALPDVCAVVNPHRDDNEYPFRNLAGVGVVFKLLCALEGNAESVLDKYADIIAVGTIADVMPVLDENRRIASAGLKKLEITRNQGLIALMNHSGIMKYGRQMKKISSATVGYVLAPRINAAGRIAFASRAVELLLTQDESEADSIAAELCEINKLRQTTEQIIYEQATEMIAASGADDKFIVLAYDGWHQGVIGIVASKIAEKYSRPCILFSLEGNMAKGSGRSIKGFSLMDALSACGELLLEYGGHELAAGLSIKRELIDSFREKINEYASPLLKSSDAAVPLEIECEASLSDITESGIDEMLGLEPFGLSNPQPVLVARSVEICDIVPLSMGKHIKFRLADGGCSVGAVWFGMSYDSFAYSEGDFCDVVFTADINEYFGVRSAQVFVRAIALSAAEGERISKCNESYNALVSGEGEGRESDVPELSDFRTVFKFVKREVSHEERRLSLTSVCRKLFAEYGTKISECKLRITLEVLCEQGLISIERFPNGNAVRIKLLPAPGKINIDDSVLLRSVRGRQSR